MTVSAPTTDLRILIIADDPLARAGLGTLLADQPDCTITAQVPGGAGLATALEVYRPDVVVWDLGWDPAPALEQLADLELPMIALLPDETYAADAWTAGAQGILLREVTAEHLGMALTVVAQGLMILDPVLADALQPPGDMRPMLLPEELTPRELEVLQLLAQGLSNKAIAYQLGISEHTVKFHVNAIMSKLRAQSRTEAAVQATRMGLIIL